MVNLKTPKIDPSDFKQNEIIIKNDFFGSTIHVHLINVLNSPNEVELAGKVAAGKAWWIGACWIGAWWTGAGVAVEMN